MKMTMKNRSHKCNINRPRTRLGHKYSKYKKCLSMLMLICITQHLSNIWSWIYGKVKQHWVEKKALLIKKRVYQLLQFILEQKVSEKNVWYIHLHFRKGIIWLYTWKSMYNRRDIQLARLIEKSWYKNRQLEFTVCYIQQGLRKVSLIYSSNFSQILIELFIGIIMLQHLCF